MAGWGLVGLGGAWLAAVTRRRLGRLGLAVACAVAGFAYGALLDLSVMVTYGGEQSLDRYLALSARGRAVQRRPRGRQLRDRARRRPGAGADDLALPHPARVQLAGRPGRCSLLLVALVAAGAVGRRRLERGGRRREGPARAPGSRAPRTTTAASRRRQGQPSSPAMTGWAMLGLEAARHQPARPARGRRDAGLLPALRGGPAALGRRPRADDPRARAARASTRAASPARTSSPSCASAATATARSTARST